MKLKRKIAKLDEVAEALRANYQPEGDAFVLKEEFEVPDPVDVTGLTRNRDAILAEKVALEQKFAGIDPEKARAALKQVETKDTKDKTEADRLSELEKTIENERTARLAAEQRANIERVKSTAVSALGVAKGRPGADTLLWPVIEKRVNADGVVLQEDGKTPALDEKGAPLSMLGLIEGFKKQDLYAPLFEATGAGGSGAPAGSQTGSGAAVKKISSGDQAAMNQNIAAIASGEAVLTE
jgi:hypothetical protein